MAKKKAARGGFNMSEEIRALLQENPGLNSREVFEALQAKFPNQTLNRNSCNVAFSHARRRLGIGGKRGAAAVRRRRPSAVVASSGNGDSVDFALLKAARELLSQAGSADAAVAAIQQLQALQLN